MKNTWGSLIFEALEEDARVLGLQKHDQTKKIPSWCKSWRISLLGPSRSENLALRNGYNEKSTEEQILLLEASGSEIFAPWTLKEQNLLILA